MVKSFLVIGLGRFGKSTALTLTQLGHEVLAVDRNEENIDSIKDQVLHALVADATDERVLARLGVGNFDCVVVCVGDDLRSSILITVQCRELGARRIVSKAQDALHAKLLLKTGADRAVQPEHDGGIRLAQSLVSDSVIDSLDISQDFSINEILVPAAWVGKTLSGLDVRKNYRVSVVALCRNDSVSVNIDPQERFQSGDRLFVIGDNRDLEELED